MARLEALLRAHYGKRHALCVSNATTGLLALAVALEMRGQEFLTTPYTWGGTLAGWLLLGNRPRFADIDEQTLGIDPESARTRITKNTAAILAVDIYGIPSDTAALRRLALEHDLLYIADAAQSLFAYNRGRPASIDADALVVSFGPGKAVDAGEGGAIVTDDDLLYEKLLWHTQHPRRQRRELGLGCDNEFALNARIHPAAAEAVALTWDDRYAETGCRRRDCMRWIERLEAGNRIEPSRLALRGIEPSFPRCTAAWKGIQEDAGGWRISPAPVRLLYRQPAFLAQYGPIDPPECPRAERQQAVRVCVEPQPEPAVRIWPEERYPQCHETALDVDSR